MDADRELPTSLSDEATDVATALQGLADVRQQEDIERHVTTEAKAAQIDEENKKDEGRIANLRHKIQAFETQIASLTTEKSEKQKLAGGPGGQFSRHALQSQLNSLSGKIDALREKISDATDEIAAFEERIQDRNLTRDKSRTDEDAEQIGTHSHGPKQQAGETHREFLIRTGKITPFARFTAEDDEDGEVVDVQPETHSPDYERVDGQKSHQVLQAPGFSRQMIREPVVVESGPLDSETTNLQLEFGLRPRKRKPPSTEPNLSDDDHDNQTSTRKRGRRTEVGEDDSDFDAASAETSNDENLEENGDDNVPVPDEKARIDLSTVDDGNEGRYQMRLARWAEQRSRIRQELGRSDDDTAEEEWFRPTPGKPDGVIIDDYRLPEEVYDFLFPFQKVGIQWLAELHKRLEGGMLCDEMGLGKTVQVIAFIAALHYSQKLNGPVIIVAPATLMPQWVKHFHTWWPPLRVSVLHSTGSGMMNPSIEDEDLVGPAAQSQGIPDAAQKIINRVVKKGHVLVTTYRGLQTYLEELADVDWGYAVLDEGHIIRNRNTEASKACKQLRTYHRIILSGTPVQNNLRELFSLFEFIYPGLLGNDLKAFTEHFELPIREGHHKYASSLAILTSERCTKTLREAVKPYMLRRVKVDVADSLPPKTEQVFFCKLTPEQEKIYCEYLESPQVNRVFDWRNSTKNDLFSAIHNLRQICNHPDLRFKDRHNLSDWGNPARSVKMQVLASLLRICKRFNHKTLVFSQSLRILDIIQAFLNREGMSSVRMDGRTNQIDRQPMVDRFNTSPDLDVFLLTPQTGGLGLNLTGADRVILFDPSWNPATDRQAIERAWRLGQTKPVEIYRLLTPGTIEEKIYRKQLYKQFMSEKIMSDAEFHTTFDTSSVQDMFTYGSQSLANDGELFAGAEAKFDKNSKDPLPDTSIPSSKPTNEKSKIQESETHAIEDKELRTVDSVRVVEEYNPAPSAEKDMLDAVFHNSVESAYEHEEIMSAKRKVRADRLLTEKEANRLNELTVSFLKRQAAAAYHERQRSSKQAASGGGSGIPSSILPKRPRWSTKTIRPLLLEFFKSSGGKARTEVLVGYFNRKHRDIPGDLFKQALNQVAFIEQMPRRGGSVWHLNPGL